MNKQRPVNATSFPNFMETEALAPQWFWQIARVVVVAVAVLEVYLLIAHPDTGLALGWKVLVPILPIVFAVAPGLWRNVCPMAVFNQLPRMFGFSRGLTLSAPVKVHAYVVAMALFFIFVSLRHPWLNHDGPALAAILVGSLVLAFVGGLFFKGRSGWCGTFCPLGPIQKIYGQAPLFMVRNAFCDPCLGCQKNCYDFNPRAAVFSDFYDDDEWYAGHRRFYAGALPGFVYAFFTVGSPKAIGLDQYVIDLFTVPLLTIGVFHFLLNFTRIRPFRIFGLFGVSALAIFYWFASPLILSGLSEVFHVTAPSFTVVAMRSIVVVVAATVLARAIIGERVYLRAVTDAAAARVGGGAKALKERIAKHSAGGELHEHQSGKRIAVGEEQTLLDAIESAGLTIETGCRMGACGADVVAIVEGAENLSPPTEVESATLRRLGLEGKARLACACKVKGSVGIDLGLDAKTLAKESEADPAARSTPADSKRVVIIGNGIAGITVADQLRKADADIRIDVITREHHHFYNRMGLGRAIYGRSAMDGLYLMPDSWYEQNNVTVWRNTTVQAIERDTKRIVLGTNETLSYDQLVIATGATARTLAFDPPAPAAGTFVLREAEDAFRIRAWRQQHDCRTAVVQGGGVLGIEAAECLRQLGLTVTIVHNSNYLMNRQLDPQAADILQRYLTGIGITVLTNASVEAIVGDDRVREVRLADGRMIPADLYLACLGSNPNADLAVAAGLDVNRGIVVDAQMRTSDPDIMAVGDVAEYAGTPSGLWPEGMEQGKVAAAAILGKADTYNAPNQPVYLKVDGIHVSSIGNVQGSGDGVEELTSVDSTGTRWRRVLVADNRMIGGVFIDEPDLARQAKDLIERGTDLSAIMGRLREGHWEALKKIVS